MDYSIFSRFKAKKQNKSEERSDYGMSSRRQGRPSTGRPQTALTGTGFQARRQSHILNSQSGSNDQITIDLERILDKLSKEPDLKLAKQASTLLHEQSQVKVSSHSLVLRVKIALALGHTHAGNYEESIAIYHQFIQDGVDQLVERYYINIAHNHFLAREYDKSIKYYQIAHDKLNIAFYKTKCLYSLACIHMLQMSFEKAIIPLNEALSYSFDARVIQMLFQCYKALQKEHDIKKIIKEVASGACPNIDEWVIQSKVNDVYGIKCEEHLVALESLIQYGLECHMDIQPYGHVLQDYLTICHSIHPFFYHIVLSLSLIHI